MSRQKYRINIACFVFCLLGLSCSGSRENITDKNLRLLTSHPWVYYEYFTDYNTTNTILAYKRSKENNYKDLSMLRVSFHDDGTYDEIAQSGEKITGTWKILLTGTNIEIMNKYGVYLSSIITLTENNYEWYDSTSGNYGKMKPE